MLTFFRFDFAANGSLKEEKGKTFFFFFLSLVGSNQEDFLSIHKGRKRIQK